MPTPFGVFGDEQLTAAPCRTCVVDPVDQVAVWYDPAVARTGALLQLQHRVDGKVGPNHDRLTRLANLCASGFVYFGPKRLFIRKIPDAVRAVGGRGEPGPVEGEPVRDFWRELHTAYVVRRQQSDKLFHQPFLLCDLRTILGIV